MGLLDDLRETLPDPLTRSLSGGPREDGTGVRSRYGGARRGQRTRTEVHGPPRDDIQRYRRQYETTPLLSAPINQETDDVTGDGWRIEADERETQEFLAEWGESAALVSGVQQDLIELIDLWNKTLNITGTTLVEHVPAAEDAGKVAGVKMIPTATVSYYTRPGSSMLLQPDDTDVEGAKTTESGEAAAFVQYDEDLATTWTDRYGNKLEENRLTIEDVSKTVLNPGVGSLTGNSAIETVSEQVESLKNTFRNDELAIESMAWGQWFAGFEPIEMSDGTIIEFEDGAQDDFEETVGKVQPGDLITHDGKINIQNLPGEVADVIDRYNYHTDYILSAMPAPRFMTGFADNLNRDIAEDQAEAHQQRIDARKQRISRVFTPIFKTVAEQHDLDPSGVKFELSPEPEASPIMSLSDEEIERIGTYADAVKKLSGASDPSMLVSEDVLLDQVLQLGSEDAKLGQQAGARAARASAVDEDNPAVARQMERLQTAMTDGGEP